MRSGLLLASLAAVLPLAGAPVRARIVADDGLPLPAGLKAELRCDKAILAAGNADEEGDVLFDLDLPATPCELSVQAPGYRPATIAISDLPDDPRIPALALYRLGKGYGETISVSHLAAPAEARRLYRNALRKARRATAEPAAVLADLEAAVEIDSAYAQAWFEIGRLRLALSETGQALEAFRRAVAADPWFVSPYEPLMLLQRASGEAEAAAATCSELRRINPRIAPGCGFE